LGGYIETGGKAATDNACDDFRAVCAASNVTRHAPRALGPRTGQRTGFGYNVVVDIQPVAVARAVQSVLNCSASCGDRIGCLAMDPFPGPLGHGEAPDQRPDIPRN